MFSHCLPFTTPRKAETCLLRIEYLWCIRGTFEMYGEYINVGHLNLSEIKTENITTSHLFNGDGKQPILRMFSMHPILNMPNIFFTKY